MAEKLIFKMLLSVFLFLFVSKAAYSLSIENVSNKCSCFNICCKNLTGTPDFDLSKVLACQRGCRFYILDLHASHSNDPVEAFKTAKENCLKSCAEGYTDASANAACKMGCNTFELPLVFCGLLDEVSSSATYSLLIEESDVLVHSGEPEPDDSLTDPALRKQVQKAVVSVSDGNQKLPDIRFKSLPVKTEKLIQTTLRCPKLYGFDSNFEFRNGKIIIGDLYLFAAVLIFVVLCFIISLQLERSNMKRQIYESQMNRKEHSDKKPLLKIDIQTADEKPVEKAKILIPTDMPDEIVFSEPNSQLKLSKVIVPVMSGDPKKKNNPLENVKI